MQEFFSYEILFTVLYNAIITHVIAFKYDVNESEGYVFKLTAN